MTRSAISIPPSEAIGLARSRQSCTCLSPESYDLHSAGGKDTGQTAFNYL